MLPTDGAQISWHELQEELARFRAYYVQAVRTALRGTDKFDPIVDAFFAPHHYLDEPVYYELARSTSLSLRDSRFSQSRVFQLNDRDIDSDTDLYIVDLSRRNPIELVVVAVALPLVAAVIVSGGKFELGPLKVELHPLGDGVAKLRAALRPLQPLEIDRRRRTGSDRL